MENAECAEIRGSWAQEPKEMISVDYLLELFINQLACWPREVGVRKWHALADKLDLVHPGDLNRDMLVRMQQYIATPPPEMRCPCTRGIVLNTIEEHFPECDASPALELKAKQLAEVKADRIQLDVKRQRIEHKWLDNKTTAEHLQATWDPAVLTHCRASSTI